MHFDEEGQAFVVDSDFCLPAKFYIHESYEIPPHGNYSEAISQETRVMRCTFENRWSLSIIWGSMTYSTNHEHPFFFRGQSEPFTDEPNTVEVGIIMPEPFTRPAVKIDFLPSWKGPKELPAHEVELWGDPLGYVDAAGVRYLVGVVSRFDSHHWPRLDSGPYLDTDDEGRFVLNYTVDTEEGTAAPCDDSTPNGNQQ